MSNYEVTGERNYAAKVIQITRLVELPGLDNLRGVPVDGYMALVSKDTPIGALMVMFPAECQLAPNFARAMNLYRKPELNANPDATGYLEESARVRAIKLRSHVSSALLIEGWRITNEAHLTVGMEFDTINGEKISWKYIPPTARTSTPRSGTRAEKAWRRVEDKFLPEHPDTSQYLRDQGSIPEDAWFVVSQKLHGTSIRIGNTVVKRKLAWWETMLAKCGVKVADHEYDHVYGSRKVVKDPKNPSQSHYYDTDIWTGEGAKYAPLLPKGVVLYGELIGWVPGTDKPIQKGYTYQVPTGEAHLYVYRVSVVTEDAGQYDMGDTAMREFCAARGLNVVPKLWEGYKRSFEHEQWMDCRFAELVTERWMWDQPVPLAKESPVDEGVVIRVEGILPKMWKLKGPEFYAHETKILDKGQVDIETEESAA